MKRRIRDMWCEDLESNEFAQGEGKLLTEYKKEDKFCCLGVLTNLYVEETGDASVWNKDEFILHNKVRRWAGLGESDPILGSDSKRLNPFMATCSRLNDGSDGYDRKNFKEISASIKENL